MSSRKAPAYCSTKPATPSMPHAPRRSPTPAESAQDLEEEEAFFGADLGVDAEVGFLLGDAGVEDAAVARRDERRAGVAAMVAQQREVLRSKRKEKSELKHFTSFFRHRS